MLPIRCVRIKKNTFFLILWSFSKISFSFPNICSIKIDFFFLSQLKITFQYDQSYSTSNNFRKIKVFLLAENYIFTRMLHSFDIFLMSSTYCLYLFCKVVFYEIDFDKLFAFSFQQLFFSYHERLQSVVGCCQDVYVCVWVKEEGGCFF